MSRFRIKKNDFELPDWDEWDAFIHFWQSLADHGLGPFGNAEVEGKPCPKCQDFCAGGGADKDFIGLCFHCWNSVAHVEPRCPLCSGEITLKDLPGTTPRVEN